MCSVRFESQPVDRTAPHRARMEAALGFLEEAGNWKLGAGQYCVNDLQTKLEKKTRASGG